MYFNFLSVLFTKAQPKGPHPPTPGSHASARQRLAPSGPLNELRGRDAAGPEAGKNLGASRAWSPERPTRARAGGGGGGSGRPGRGGDSCDPAPLSHLEHVACSGVSGGGHPALTPPTTERWLRRPARARFLRRKRAAVRVTTVQPIRSGQGLARKPRLETATLSCGASRLERRANASPASQRPLRRRLLGGGKAPPQCGRHAGVRGGRSRPRAPLGIGLRRCDWAPGGVG